MASERALAARLALSRATGFSLDCELSFPPGLNVLFGPSGSGKTTVLAALAGLLEPQAGRITLGARVLFDAEQRLALAPDQRRIALVFQSLALFPHLTALENVAYGVRATRSARAKRARDWLGRMRVEHLAERLPHGFSGGEAQRVALARALASEPEALLLDEPFSALDRELASELAGELLDYVQSLSIPVVLVTHDRALALALDSSVTLLSGGRVQRVGPALELLSG